MSPLAIQILLHCFCRGDKFPGLENSAQKQIIEEFLDVKLIETTKHKDIYVCTTLGKAHVKQLKTLPLPTLVYVNYNGDIIC